MKTACNTFLAQTLHSMLANSADMIFVKDLDLVYHGSSPAFARLVGLDGPEQLVGKTDYDIFNADLATRYTDDDRKLLRSGVPIVDLVEPIPEENGRQRFSSTSKYLIKDDQGRVVGLYGIGRDITRQLELTREAQAANEARSDFLARMSHDMRTPMNGIIGLLALTQEEDMPDGVRDALKKIERSSKYLLRLINDTLDMKRIEKNRMVLTPENVSSKKFLEALLASVRPTIEEKHIAFTVRMVNVSLLPVRIDAIRVQQLFTNIISNAVKYTREGGTIEFLVEGLSRDAAHADIRCTIRDNGVGIDEDFLPHIFEPFFQESNAVNTRYAGTGLGMTIVKHLVELMGGDIEVRSQKGRGTDVVVRLRVEYGEEPRGPAPDSGVEEAKLRGKRILFCEDHPLNAEIATRLLQKKGCHIECAQNGEMGLSMFSRSAVGYYDLVLMDIRMPVMDGLEATRAIRKLPRPDAVAIPIIALSANAFEEDARQSLAAGMNAHLAKPIEPDLLYKTLSLW